MVKKKSSSAAKAAVKASKKTKAAQKIERKETKKSKTTNKRKDEPEDEQDLEALLDKMRREWEEAHTITEEAVEGPPTRRANATLTTCPSGNYLWCIGGEVLSDDGKAYFFNDVYRYSPEKDEWRKYTSPNCPGPRSAHAVVASPAAGGLLFLFGGEFSSPSQNSFHHYRDFWAFSVTTHAWERIDTKVKPSARSGCRMAIWKHLIILFGGFHDVGIRTSYLKDLWLFDTQTYKWQEVVFSPTARQPSARSGFSFVPVAEGVILHGGYCKEYTTSSGKGKAQSSQGVGKALEDTYILLMNSDPKQIKWDKRKRVGFFPNPPRSGCTMAYWAAKNMGVLFGGVSDQEVDDELMTSTFYNDMFGYKTEGQGRWISLPLKKPKKKVGQKKIPAVGSIAHRSRANESDGVSDNDEEEEDHNAHGVHRKKKIVENVDQDPDDPLLTTPLVRYNAMLAVLRNTLYIYGGIYEWGSKEYTLDDFHSIALDKLERFVCLRSREISIPTGDPAEESSDDDDDDSDSESEGSDSGSDDSSDEDREEQVIVGEENVSQEANQEDGFLERTTTEKNLQLDKSENGLPSQTSESMQNPHESSVVPQKTEEDPVSTPLPGETLAMFYSRSRDYWAQQAMRDAANDARGKELRRDGFALAEERYVEYKPMLQEVERILEEAGLDGDDMKRGASAGNRFMTGSRNRR